MAFNQLPSMVKLMASPRLNTFFIKRLNNYNKNMVKHPELATLFQQDPPAFDRLSLRLFNDGRMHDAVTMSVWGAVIILVPTLCPYLPDPFMQGLVGTSVENADGSITTITEVETLKIDVAKHVNNVLPVVGCYTIHEVWDWFRSARLLLQINEEKK